MLEDMRTLEGIDTCPVAWLDIWAIQLEDMRTLEGIDTFVSLFIIIPVRC